MKLFAATSLLITAFSSVSGSVVLTKALMNLAKEAAVLSAKAYDIDPTGDGYIEFSYYNAEPDQALFAKTTVGGNDYCFGVFRGTTMTLVDWKQNVEPGSHEVCVDLGDDQNHCCTTRKGFYDAYTTSYVKEIEVQLRDCAKSCTNKDECLVLTGHSQGGAVAAVAGLVFADLNPYVITFGQPNTIATPCSIVTSERWFRFVNTKSSPSVGITYDPVPFSPGLGTGSFGHMIVLGDDSSGVAYIGLDAQDFFSPLNVAGFEAHSMISTTAYPGYLDRLDALMTNATYPIRNNGYVAGSLCSQDKECESNTCAAETHFTFNRCVGRNCNSDEDCDTNRCDSGVCIQKLGSCEPCDEASDCAGSHCLLFQCSNEQGLMDNACTCKRDSDCESGRCEGITPPVCEAQLGLGATCNEASDCKSNYCTWSFVCGEVAPTSAPVIVVETITTTETEEIIETEEEIETEETSSGGSGVGLMIGILLGVLVVIVLGYFGIKKFMQGREGYESIPSTTMDV